MEELEAIKKEFVASEADESDDELDFGFGKTHERTPRTMSRLKMIRQWWTIDCLGLKNSERMPFLRNTSKSLFSLNTMISSESVFREHFEEDESNLQKIHEAAVAGKLRGGRKRGRDVAMSDSESEDEEYRHRPKSEKRVISWRISVCSQHQLVSISLTR